MAWDPVWQKIFKERGEWGKYPPEELIRFIAKNYYKEKDRGKVKILDLGCGYGSATWYLAREGFDTYAIDGSPTIVNKLGLRLKAENLHADLKVGDINQLPYENESIDCVVDLMCLMCNDNQSTKTILNNIYRVLKPGGKLFSYTPDIETWGFGSGIKLDEFTYDQVQEGIFACMGVVRYSTQNEIKKLYGKLFELEINRVSRTIDHGKHSVTYWVISGKKK